MHNQYTIEHCKRVYGFYSEALFIDEKGEPRIKANTVNYKIILRHLYPELRYSTFERAILDGNKKLTTDDVSDMRDALVGFFKGQQISLEATSEAVRGEARRKSFNPLEEYFVNIPVDKDNVLDTWLIDICGAEDTPITRVIGRKFLISAVARALRPGCYVEGSLIFYGKQAAGKSRLIKTLNPIESFYCASNVNIASNRDASQSYQGKFIVEFAELSQLRKGEIEDIKRFLTEQVDTYVPKYSNIAEDVPRQMVFCGSTNEPDILLDTTGNRRFWPVEVGDNINVDKLERIKFQLWGEAYQAYIAKEQWVLTPEERELLDAHNTTFEADDPLTDYLSTALRGYDHSEFRAAELQELARLHDPKVHSKAIAKSMRRLGYKRSQITSGSGKGTAVYVAPDSDDWN